VNGVAGTAPLVVNAVVGTPVTLDAAGTADPDRNAVSFAWWFYPEAGTGIPGQPVVRRVRRAPGQAPPVGAGGVPSAPVGGPPQPPARVVIEKDDGPVATVIPKVPGLAHVILTVRDNGTPPLTSYRRVILDIAPQ
jgi:hypothetical protein